MFDKIKKIKSHEFKTTIYESKIEFDHKKLMGLIDYDPYKKTYKISERFNKAMIKIGLMWIREFGREHK